MEEAALEQPRSAAIPMAPVVPFPEMHAASGSETRAGSRHGSELGEETCRPLPNQPLTLERALQLLGVSASSTREQIRAAYRRMAGLYHPDRMHHSSETERRAATERMISINEAYRLLCATRMEKTA